MMGEVGWFVARLRRPVIAFFLSRHVSHFYVLCYYALFAVLLYRCALLCAMCNVLLPLLAEKGVFIYSLTRRVPMLCPIPFH